MVIAKKYRILATVSLLVFLLDQFTKWLVLRSIAYQEVQEVIPHLLNLTNVWNRGAAFSLFSEWSAYLFIVISVVAVGFIVYYFSRLDDTQKWVVWGLSFILGGAIGNLLDRARLHHVVDFIDLHFGEGFHWPAFNVADVAITMGVGLLIYDMFKDGGGKRTG
ncbi:MAG: signal peptidase II [Deltaproteobacteria bacterium]|nr:MAG: signal peptidase II [Deltaproteobacteria bacterium]